MLTHISSPFLPSLQLAALSLAHLLPQADEPAAAATQAWAAAALRPLQQAAAAVSEDGGMLHDPDCFADLYRCWLALWAAAHLPAGDPSWAADMAAAVQQLAAAAEAAAQGTVPQLAAAATATAAAWQLRVDGDAAAATDNASAGLCFLV